MTPAFWILVRELTWSDFKLRYVRTRLGLLWAILKPFLIFAVLYGVFTLLLGTQAPDFLFALLLGVILWNFFGEATVASIVYLKGRREVVQKINFPLLALPLAACLQAGIILLINLIIFSIVAAVADGLPLTAILLPLVLVSFFALTLGISLLLAGYGVRYGDVQHMWDIGLQLGFFLSPVIYPLYFIPAELRPWYLLNPVAQVIQQSRLLVLSGQLELPGLLVLTVFSAGLLIVGLLLFHKLVPTIREFI